MHQCDLFAVTHAESGKYAIKTSRVMSTVLCPHQCYAHINAWKYFAVGDFTSDGHEEVLQTNFITVCHFYG